MALETWSGVLKSGLRIKVAFRRDRNNKKRSFKFGQTSLVTSSNKHLVQL